MMTEYTRWCVLQLSHENECEGLLPDCRVGVKERERRRFKLNALAARTTTHFLNHGMSLTIVWQGRLRVTVGQQGVRWLQIRASHDRSYIAWISLLAYGLTVELNPYHCSHTDIYVGIANATCYLLRLAPGWFSILLVTSVVESIHKCVFGRPGLCWVYKAMQTQRFLVACTLCSWPHAFSGRLRHGCNSKMRARYSGFLRRPLWLYHCHSPVFEFCSLYAVRRMQKHGFICCSAVEPFNFKWPLYSVMPTIRVRTVFAEAEQKNVKQNNRTWLERWLTIKEY